MDNAINLSHVTLGVCYYPEHWPEAMWRNDLRRMKEYGIEVVRVAEFAWNKFEPREGEYTFDFFDRFMDLAQEEGLQIIFCTPTATAPVWMSHKYPEILNADIDGNRLHPGLRRQNSLNSPVYLDFSAKITEQLARHYSSYPNLIGWQLDNEINCEKDVYYSESDHIAFRQYLKDKYGTLDRLNEAMGTAFWNQTYTDWNEVFLTRRTNFPGETNPHMQLEEKRFVSNSAIRFLKLQADIIKRYRRADQFITTNGLYHHLDYHKLTNDVLDFITYDNYPNFAHETSIEPSETNGLEDRNASYRLMYTRSISPVFGIMEQQAGGGGWNFRIAQTMPKPGQMRLWTWQAIAHGADFISYFRWRTCTFGTEMCWYGLNNYSNRPNRRLTELSQINEERKRLDGLSGARYVAETALMLDYDNEWEGEHDVWHGACSYASNDAWFCCLQKRHVPLDMVYLTDDTALADLLHYKHIIYPHGAIMTEKRAALLRDYVNNGGTLILGCLTGYKTETGTCRMAPVPGPLAELCGVEVHDFTALSKFDAPEQIVWQGRTASAPIYNEILTPTDGAPFGCFQNNYYDGAPAIIQKSTGKGQTYYVGSAFAEDTAALLADMAGIKPPLGLGNVLGLPETVELAIREKAGTRYIFLLNYQDSPAKITLQKPMKELLSGQTLQGACEIDGYGCLVFAWEA